MFDGQQHNDWDLQMRSILESGQEEVPAHIWDGVSSELDAIARGRKAVVFWRRTAIGLSAAAVLAVGFFLGHQSEDKAIDTIAEVTEIVEPVYGDAVSVIEKADAENLLTAMVPETGNRTQAVLKKQNTMPSCAVEAMESVYSEETAENNVEKVSTESEIAAVTTEDNQNWVEEESEIKERSTDVSLVLSGIAGTNSAQGNAKTGVIRRPTLSAAPVKTSVTQTEPGDTYGIPLSFGVGTKIGFNSRWSLGVGINYTMLNRKFYGDYTKVEDSRIESIKSDIRNTQHYVGIPVNAYYNIVENKFVNFYAYAGGAVEKCVSDEYRVMAKDILHKERVAGVQASANIGIGAEFMLGNHLGIYIDPSARYYFNCNQPKSIRTAQPLMLGFEMGLRVRL